MEELIQCLDNFKEITCDLDLANCENLKNFKEFPYAKELLTMFDYLDKSLIYGDRNEINIRNTNHDNSTTINEDFIKKEKKSYNLDKLPTSISEKYELRRYNQEKHVIRKPNTNIEFNIPNSLKLEGIADINFTTNNLTSEDYLNSNQKPNQGETHAPLGNIIYDDINFDYQTPVDFLKNYNLNKKATTKTPIPFNSSNNDEIVTNTNITNSSLTNNTIRNPQTLLNNNPISSIPNIPVKNNIPSVPITSIPSVPKVPPVMNVPKIPNAPKIPNIVPNFVEVSKLDNQALVNRGSLLDQIRNVKVSNLKKLNTEEKKPEPVLVKKKEIKSMTANPHDLLKQAIALRYEKLNKNKHEDE